jgi:flagellar biosynthesis/type III secretory pathway protein FliH
MMSSSRSPRPVHVIPRGTDPIGTQWSPDELPRPALSQRDGAANEPDPRLTAAIEDAFARGYEEGRRAGALAEAARLRGAIHAVSGAAELVEQEAMRWVGNAEENICALAVTVARHVLDRELETDRARILETVQRALAEFPVTESVRVRLNPADLQLVTALQGGDEPPAGRPAAIRWSGDPLIAVGGCLIEGHERIIDGRVDAALERMYRRLSNAGS